MTGRLAHRIRMVGRLATVWGRPRPDFIIIGAQKCGTTSLHDYIVRHPAVAAAMRRSLKFFDDAPSWAKGVLWYRAHFPFVLARTARSGRPLVGECTPTYLFHPLGARRVREAIPGAKLIVMLRNPVDRTYSAYHHRRRRPGAEPLPFEEALERETERVGDEYRRLATDPKFVSYPWRLYSYLSWGRYADYLEPWIRIFGRDQLLILLNEDLAADPDRVMAQVHAFLGLPSVPLDDYPRLNVGRYDTPLDSRVRERLTAHFAPHNKRLAALLGRDPGWDA